VGELKNHKRVMLAGDKKQNKKLRFIQVRDGDAGEGTSSANSTNTAGAQHLHRPTSGGNNFEDDTRVSSIASAPTVNAPLETPSDELFKEQAIVSTSKRASGAPV
jgi:hypothetical protein